MRVLVLHAAQGKIAGWAKVIEEDLAKHNVKADLVASGAGSGPISTAQYQLVCVISPFNGLFKPQVPSDIDSMIKKCTRLEGKRAVAIVPSKFGSAKALKVLMGLLERQGVIVEDFAAIKGDQDVLSLTKRITKLI